MIGEFLGERERGTHQPRDPLPQRAVESLDVISLTGQLGDRTGLGGGNDARVRGLVIRREDRLLLIHGWNFVPSSENLATANPVFMSPEWVRQVRLWRRDSPSIRRARRIYSGRGEILTSSGVKLLWC